MCEDDNSLLIKDQVVAHLDGLSSKLEEWFGDLPGDELDWVRNRLRDEEWDMPLKHLEELSDLQADRTTVQQFNATPLDTFWLSLSTEYPSISARATRVLLPFSTTYLSEAIFSDLTYSKNKHRNRLDVKHDLRIAATRHTAPRIPQLVSKMQAHKSH
ncbi:Zinc finger BED domain-containing protein 5 [Frankliniella fusca]|uniref:Zinc finger BED domain-containing protein 5 n=1 Tax=Frankliniella fusca TaxID=407009 RepID=A0AAE1H0V3_9NEOP|nr:Zinc finger BED domain-containing protein 5 [Frankliniella fusca]